MTFELLGVDDRRWPDPVSGPWVLRLVFGLLGDRPGVVSVQLYAADPEEIKRAARTAGAAKALASNPWRTEWAGSPDLPAPRQLTTSGIRLPLAELTAEYVASLPGLHEEAASLSPEWKGFAAKVSRQLERTPATRRGPGRPASYDRRYYERVAEVYTRALREGRPPTKSVAEEMAGGSKSAATKWVAKARDLGLLPKTAKGKAAAWPVRPKRGRSQP